MRQVAMSLVLLTAMFSPFAALAAISPAKLNVQVADLPAHSAISIDKTLTASQAAALDQKPAAAYRRLGLVLVDERGFDVVTKGAHPYIFTEVAEMSSVAAAHSFFVAQVKRARAMDGSVYKRIPLGKLGNERFAVKGADTQTGKSVPASFAVLRRGKFLLILLISGLNKGFPAAQTLRLASLVDGRIESAN